MKRLIIACAIVIVAGTIGMLLDTAVPTLLALIISTLLALSGQRLFLPALLALIVVVPTGCGAMQAQEDVWATQADLDELRTMLLDLRKDLAQMVANGEAREEHWAVLRRAIARYIARQQALRGER